MQVTVIAAGFDSEVQRQTPDTTADRPAPHIIRLKTAEQARPQAGPEPATAISAEGKGQVEYLFPQDEPDSRPLGKVEPDEDMGIPAFMRRRRRSP